jgi:hypothetical protein
MKLPAPLQAAVIALCVIPIATQALAISRYQSKSMSCANINATIANEGAAIFRWTQPPDIDRFGKFVRNVGYCFRGEEANYAYIPSADNAKCPVLECQPEDDDLFFNRFGPRGVMPHP